MKHTANLITAVFAFGLISLACGPTPEELRQQELARQDSLKKVQEQALAAAVANSTTPTAAPQASAPSNETPVSTESAAPAPQQNDADKERLYVKYDANGTLTLQLEAWRNQRSAEKSVDKWKKRGFENAYAVSQENAETGEVWYRVRIGKFRSRKWAVKQAELLKEQYKAEAWIDNATNEVRVY